MVNQALLSQIRAESGEAAGDRILRELGHPEQGFELTRSYPDELTLQMVQRACQLTRDDAPSYLRRFGRSWVPFVTRSEYAGYLDRAGSSFLEVVVNLDSMHREAGVAFPELHPPSFRSEGGPDGDTIVHYYSQREGLAPFVVGLLEGLAEHFGEDAEVEHAGADGDHDIFRVRLRGDPATAAGEFSEVDTVERLLQHLPALRTLPATLHRARALADDEDSSIFDAVELIEQDPSLATEVLRIANSSLYARPPSSSLHEACVTLGLREIAEVVFIAAIGQGLATPSRHFPLESFWRVCQRVALASRWLALGLHLDLRPDVARTCGLLHHVGKLALLQAAPQVFAEVWRSHRATKRSFRESLRQRLGYDDRDVLRGLAAQWQLGPEIEASAASPDTGPWARIVHAADHLVGADLWPREADGERAREQLGLNDELERWVRSRLEESERRS